MIAGEAGPPDRNPSIHIPAAVVYTLDNPDINWMYKTEPSRSGLDKFPGATIACWQ